MAEKNKSQQDGLEALMGFFPQAMTMVAGTVAPEQVNQVLGATSREALKKQLTQLRDLAKVAISNVDKMTDEQVATSANAIHALRSQQAPAVSGAEQRDRSEFRNQAKQQMLDLQERRTQQRKQQEEVMGLMIKTLTKQLSGELECPTTQMPVDAGAAPKTQPAGEFTSNH